VGDLSLERTTGGLVVEGVGGGVTWEREKEEKN